MQYASIVFVALALISTPSISLAEQAAAADGAKVYAARKCSMCHMIAGQGNKKLPLDGIGSKLTADQIREWIADPVEAAKKANSTVKPPMRAIKDLPKADLDALVAYMLSLKK